MEIIMMILAVIVGVYAVNFCMNLLMNILVWRYEAYEKEVKEKAKEHQKVYVPYTSNAFTEKAKNLELNIDKKIKAN